MGQIKNIKLHIVTDIKDRRILSTLIIMQIFINGASTDVYDVGPSITISDLKELIEFRSGVSFDSQVLTYAGRPLTDEQTLTEGDIQESSTVYLGERLLGGKVHGSLARAGKVKGQTPKVDARRRRNPRQEGLRDDSSTTVGLSMLLLFLVEDGDPTPMLHKESLDFYC